MITKDEIQGPATFKELVLMDGLQKVNFIYGLNGSGKTTISRVIANASADANLDDDDLNFENCHVTWEGGEALKAFVYNKKFVERNFHESEDGLKGVFTLGEDNIESLQLTAALKAEIAEIKKEIRRLQLELEDESGNKGKKNARKKLKADFRKGCWDNYKKEYEDRLGSVFSGLHGSAEKFADRMLEEWKSNQIDPEIGPPKINELTERISAVYADDLKKVNSIQVPDFSPLINAESMPILKQKIVGKDDVSISAMIKKLQNSDWVREGMQYLDHSADECPFCQQKIENNFRESLNEYFDEAYAKSMDKLGMLREDYNSNAESLEEEIAALQELEGVNLEQANFEAQREILRQKITGNMELLEKKQNNPSLEVQIESLKETAQEIVKLVERANENISAHNNIVDNQEKEKNLTERQVWQFLIYQARAFIKNYIHQSAALGNEIIAIEDNLNELTSSLHEKENALTSEEEKNTSVKPTIDKINKKLKSCGFGGFLLSEAEKAGFYKIVRPDGQSAYENLSEGERNFVTFLYFFHLLDGSHSSNDIAADRVVVFDDPVSSLDSEVLFTVRSLIKETINKIADDQPTKQVFVMTHNVYFFRQMTNPPHKGTFWVVRKKDEVSKIERHQENPVKSVYQMLWEEVKHPSVLTVRNTMRRILEYYFEAMGNKKLSDLPESFDEEDRHICWSLISWLHGGSHFLDDDDSIVLTEQMLDRQKNVFRQIFDKTGGIDHYNLMMGIEDE